jgi:hypothetical protein
MLARRDELSKHLERRVREIARLRQEAIGRLGQEIRRLVLPAAGAV